jgi:plasmid stabilization system protein ParE
MRVRYTRRALGDIASIYSYIAVDNPKAARVVESVIRQTANLLADYPHLGVQTFVRVSRHQGGPLSVPHLLSDSRR